MGRRTLPSLLALILLTLHGAVAAAQTASRTGARSGNPAVTATPTPDAQERSRAIQLYGKFTEYLDADNQPAAYAVGQEYLQKYSKVTYPKSDAVLAYVSNWVAKYEKALAAEALFRSWEEKRRSDKPAAYHIAKEYLRAYSDFQWTAKAALVTREVRSWVATYEEGERQNLLRKLDENAASFSKIQGDESSPVNARYDRFTNMTLAEQSLTTVGGDERYHESIIVYVGAVYGGRESKGVVAAFFELYHFDTGGAGKYAGASTLYVVADSTPLQLPITYRQHIPERAEARALLSGEALKAVRDAKSVEFRWGGTEFALPAYAVDRLRTFIERLRLAGQ